MQTRPLLDLTNYDGATIDEYVRVRAGKAKSEENDEAFKIDPPEHLENHFPAEKRFVKGLPVTPPKPHPETLHFVDPLTPISMGVRNSWGNSWNSNHAVTPTGEHYRRGFCGVLVRYGNGMTEFDYVRRLVRGWYCGECLAKLRAATLELCPGGNLGNALTAIRVAAYKRLATILPGVRIADVNPMFDFDGDGPQLAIHVDGNDKVERHGAFGAHRVLRPDSTNVVVNGDYREEERAKLFTATIELTVDQVVASHRLWEGMIANGKQG